VGPRWVLGRLRQGVCNGEAGIIILLGEGGGGGCGGKRETGERAR